MRLLALLALPLATGAAVCEDGSCESVAMLQKHQLQEHVAGADCKGPRCGRGHPAWGATKKPFAFGAKAGGGGIEVNVDGKMEKLFLPGAHVKNDTVQYGVNDKYYLMKEDSVDYADASKFHMVKLAGNTMIADISLNGANCGCNVNFFLVKMPAGPAGQYNDHYCDANCVGGNCCAEFDINEMNDHALQITNHNCYGNPSKGSCDGDGNPMMRFGPPEYGPGHWFTIDTTKPFKFALTAQEVIVGDNDPNNHLVVHCRLWQNDKTVHKSFGGVGSPLNSQWGNLASGMALVVDYWESRHLNWLDGVGCGGGEEYCSFKKADLSAMKFIANDLEKTKDCPDKGTCKCDWFDAKSMALTDDGSECWCRCGGCSASPLVPRCTWSGYKPIWDH